jgi:hypothetical protein
MTAAARLTFLLMVALIAGACGTAAPSAAAPSAPSAPPAPPVTPSAVVVPSVSVAPPASIAPPSATVAPSPTAAASATAAPSASAAPSVARPTASPNNHAAPDLEALLPDNFRDIVLKKESYDGRILGTDPASAQLKGFLASQGKNLADFAEAGAVDPTNAHQITFVVFRVPGIDATVLSQAVVAATVAATPDLKVSTQVVGGRTVIRADEPASVRYLFASQGLVFGVQAITEAIANEGLALIP